MTTSVQTCYRHPDQYAGVVCQRCDRPICPHCMIQASVGFHCPECAKAGHQKVYTARNLPGAGLLGTPVTLILMILNIAVFLFAFIYPALKIQSPNIAGPYSLNSDGLLFAPLVARGEWWRVITSGFLHAEIFHIAVNMLALFWLGPPLERAMGRIRFIIIYFAGLLGGSLGVLLLTPGEQTVGSSTALFGLLAAILVVQVGRGLSLAETGLIPIIVLNMAITFLVPGISIGGHIGGFIGGGLATIVIVYGARALHNPRLATGLAALLPIVFFVASLLAAQAYGTTFS